MNTQLLSSLQSVIDASKTTDICQRWRTVKAAIISARADLVARATEIVTRIEADSTQKIPSETITIWNPRNEIRECYPDAHLSDCVSLRRCYYLNAPLECGVYRNDYHKLFWNWGNSPSAHWDIGLKCAETILRNMVEVTDEQIERGFLALLDN